MPDNFAEVAEQNELFRQKRSDNSGLLFNTKGSAGANPLKLAQILSTFDFVIGLLKWQDKPLADLSHFLTNYQASIDAKYHDDFKEVQIAEEIERRRAERKGLSIVSSNR